MALNMLKRKGCQFIQCIRYPLKSIQLMRQDSGFNLLRYVYIPFPNMEYVDAHRVTGLESLTFRREKVYQTLFEYIMLGHNCLDICLRSLLSFQL